MEHQLPHNIDAERAVLGASLINPKALNVALEGLQREDFYREAHRHVFDAMATLAERSEPVDLVTVRHELERAQAIDAAGGIAYLAGLIDGVPSVETIAPWCRIIREAGALRRLHADALRLAERVLKGNETAAELSEALARDVGDHRIDHGPRPVRDFAKAAITAIEKRAEMKGMIGLPTGLKELDRMTGGWQGGDLIILAARPSMGKTALALQFARQAAALFVSLEMPASKLMARLITGEAGVSHTRIGFGLSEADWLNISRAWNVVTKLDLWIDDRPDLRVKSIVRRARRLPIDFLVVDYLQLIGGSARHENRQQEIASISRDLKMAAKELEIPILALSQLSRAPEQRKDKRPMLGDLRESGALEQDADIVMFLFRESVYGKTEENESRAELILAKQRDGPVGTIRLRFQPELTLFTDNDV